MLEKFVGPYFSEEPPGQAFSNRSAKGFEARRFRKSSDSTT
jgi:hypothetical protein